jgi:hypothetical protein
MLKPGIRVIDAHVHIGCHPNLPERVCHQPTPAGIQGAAVPSDLKRLGFPWIPALSHRFQETSAHRRFWPSHGVGWPQSRPRPCVSGSPLPRATPHLTAPALTNPHRAMLTEDQPVGLPPMMSVPTSIVISSLGSVGPRVVEPRFSSSVVRFRLVGGQSVGCPGVRAPIRLLREHVGGPCMRAMDQRLH